MMYQPPPMKTREEIIAMRKRIDDIEDKHGLDDEQEAIQATLNWVLGHNTDDAITEYFEEDQ